MKFLKAFVITIIAVFVVIYGVTVAYFVTENNRIKREAEAKAQEDNRKLEAEQQKVADEQRKRELAEQKQSEAEEKIYKDKERDRELTEYVAPIEKRLSEVVGAYINNGYRQIGEHYIDGLSNGKIKAYPNITLQGGMDYVLVSTCDKDCSDIDIAIFDENDKEIVEDVESDALPIISFTANRTSQAEIRVRMHKCASSSGCYFGISLLGK